MNHYGTKHWLATRQNKTVQLQASSLNGPSVDPSQTAFTCVLG